MPYSHVQTAKQAPTAATRGTGVTSLAETFAATPAVGSLLVVFVSHFNAGGDKLTSITDNQGGGNTWTVEQKSGTPGGVHVAVCWCVPATAAGTFTITANFSGASDAVIGISEFSGNHAAPFDGKNSGNGTGTAPAGGSITPSQTGDLFVSVVADDDSDQTYTIPSGWDGKRAENPTGSSGMVLSSASKIANDASANSSTWGDTTSSNWAVAIVAFKNSGVGASPPMAKAFPGGPGFKRGPFHKPHTRQAFESTVPVPDPNPASFRSRTGPKLGGYGPNPVGRFRSRRAYQEPIPNTGFVYPLAVHGSNRYLIDAENKPFPVIGDAGWGSIMALSPSDRDLYLDDRLARGFTTIEVWATNRHGNLPTEPRNIAGALPFLKRLDGADWTGALTYGNINNEAPDFTTPNEAYWTNVDQYLVACFNRGICVAFFPAYAGNGGNSTEGWMPERIANGTTKMTTYGTWIANRYKEQANLIWMIAGDCLTQFANATMWGNEEALVSGLKSVATRSTQYSAEFSNPSTGSDINPFSTALYNALTTEPAYSWDSLYTTARAAYGSPVTVKPAFVQEEVYENNNTHGITPWRQYEWMGWLGTVGGFIYGNENLWTFPANGSWKAELGSTGALGVQVLAAFIRSLRWWDLVPSGLGGKPALITAGAGTTDDDRVTAAISTDDSVLVAYVGPSHTGTLTVNMAAMSGFTRARWFDPSNGQYQLDSTALPNIGTKVFTTPGVNAGGNNDWALVLDLSSASYNIPYYSPAARVKRGPSGRFRSRRAALAPTGGVFNDSITETATATDALSSQQAAVDAVTEAGTATDALASALSSTSAVSETAAATDSLASQATMPNPVSETGAATDSLASQATMGASTTESGTATDSLASQATMGASASETAAATDSLASQATMGAAVSESGAATDSQASQAVMGSAVTESGSATDSVTTGSVYLDSATEAAAATDAASASATMVGATTEAGSASDSTSTQQAASGVVLEQATAQDDLASTASLGVTVEEQGAATAGFELPSTRISERVLSGSVEVDTLTGTATPGTFGGTLFGHTQLEPLKGFKD